MEIAIQNLSSLVSDADVAFMAAAVDIQMREHFAPTWGIEPWPVSAYKTLPPGGGFHPMFIMDDIAVPGARGYHDDIFGFIYSRVLPPANQFDATTISHEALEAAGDPTCEEYRQMPDGRMLALETSDAVEATSYPISVTLNGVTRMMAVSNFCLPSFWVAGSKGPWDYMGLLSGPFEILPGGYEIIKERDGTIVNVFSRNDPLRGKMLAYKMADPASRTARRHARATRL